MSTSNPVLKLNGKGIYATATGVKLTSKGKVQPVSALTSDKGMRRKIRKALYRAGYTRQAAS